MKSIATYMQVWSGSSLGWPHAIFLSLQNKHARLNLFSFFGDCGVGAGVVNWGGGGTDATLCLAGAGVERRWLEDRQCGLKSISKEESDECHLFHFVLVEVCWILGSERVIGAFENFNSVRPTSDKNWRLAESSEYDECWVGEMGVCWEWYGGKLMVL